MDNFEQLHPTKHMLQWLADEPYSAIRAEVESILQKQVAGSVLNYFRVTSEPQWLTGARRPVEGDSGAILVRAGVAFEFELSVDGNGQSHELAGVFTWAAFKLDEPGNRRQQFWFDINGDLETFGADGELADRIHAV